MSNHLKLNLYIIYSYTTFGNTISLCYIFIYFIRLYL